MTPRAKATGRPRCLPNSRSVGATICASTCPLCSVKPRKTKTRSDWAKTHKALIRNQAHGSPANILDLYAVTDIPEIEGEDLLRIKFASSAAHVTGKKLT